ncbi:MAG: hypothetical protein KIT68_07855 [Phycisphaeraceae bacterium]|nr:hypothetical protein [Phycisphaeraceae bacterium]
MSHDHHQHTAHQADPADAWHTHTAAEKPQEAHAENIAHGTVLVFGIGGFAIIAATVIATIVYFDFYKTSLVAQREEGIEIQTGALAARDQVLKADFQTYGWSDPAAGKVRLKIDDGRRMVIEEYEKARR